MRPTPSIMFRTLLRTGVALLIALSPHPVGAGDVTVDGKFVSTAPTGTPPLQVDSTTLVSNLNADFLDGLPASAFGTSVGNVIQVGKTGGDFSSIQAALDSITDAAPDNWYVILVGPGAYSEGITLKPNISVIGHGWLETTIKAEGPGDVTAVAGASQSVIADVGIEAISTDGGDATAYLRSGGGQPLSQVNGARLIASTSGSGQAKGVRAAGSITVRLTDTSVFPSGGAVSAAIHMDTPASVSVHSGTLSASGGSSFNFGVWRQAVTGTGSLRLQGVAVRGSNGANGYGILSEGGAVTVEGGSVTGSGSSQGYGVWMSDGNGTVRHSRVEGANASLNSGSTATIDAAYSQIDGFIGGSGTFNCIGLYDSGMNPVSCP